MRAAQRRAAARRSLTRLDCSPAQGKALLDRYEGRHPQAFQVDRLGLVRMVHAADLRSAELAVQADRQFRRGDHLPDVHRPAADVPDCAKAVPVDGAMRKVQPKMKAIQERFKDDKQSQQQEILKLYQTEKINPAPVACRSCCRSRSSTRFTRC
jgi:hypothetical protein